MLSDFVQSITAFIESLVTQLGAPGITLVSLFENLFPPTPSEFLYPLAGKLAFDGHITLLEIAVAGVLGSLIGSLIFYGIGYRLGAARSRNAIDRYGTLRLANFQLEIFSVESFDKAMELFERRGGIIVFVARLLPLVHGVVSIPAGVTRMNIPAFLFYTALGAAGWIVPLTLLGYWLGSNWEQVLNWIDVYQNIIYVLVALFIIYTIVRRWQARRVAAQGGTKTRE